jgi:16S rRNA (uracil1498-N3)-methyltransferase
VAAPVSTKDIPAGALVLHEEAALALSAVPLPSTGDIVVVVGPEGGIAPEELALMADAQPVRLGPSVLRTSTAGPAALAVLSARLGRW